ncbi:hypothetical protein BU26DRAFT_571678 [Trematosphaeria pertusa]|uniref:Uncharacterized protein n=1 Tax=Trematosphaeria pertusa TaxID=390896 RepID=A0A6A6HTS9_9PLEO|nr:uncharacterized protein BU26DRAFT_571678 [Trematosphaeria pertusa]KAF2241516.1 hypothetical protein BU26DRAFT_571678 [Trematosphaeria pertusa]
MRVFFQATPFETALVVCAFLNLVILGVLACLCYTHPTTAHALYARVPGKEYALQIIAVVRFCITVALPATAYIGWSVLAGLAQILWFAAYIKVSAAGIQMRDLLHRINDRLNNVIDSNTAKK